ncbi:MAG: hypothetical protein HYU67_11630 [Flavobacteriia bacterium]|nr:hypothetical protein [Flavobacteriia bacterium]
MLVENFKNTATLYHQFEIWQIADLKEFFQGNGILQIIFEKEYKMKITELDSKRNDIPETDLGLMASVLDMVSDKYFYPFSFGDPAHLELVEMQTLGIMNFGTDISKIDPNKYFVVIMDKID